MAERTLVALYDRLEDAHAAMHDLVDMGVLQDQITVGVRDSEGYGMRTGVAGTSEAGRSATGGGLLSALKNLFIPDEDANVYAEGVRRGGTLLTARVAEDQVDHAMDILERYNPVDIDERVTYWRKQGWSRFDEAAAPYTDSAITEERARYASADLAATGPIGVAPTPDITGTTGAKARTQETRTTATTETGTTETGRREGEQAIPVVEEELKVGKRRVGGGRVRVRSHVIEKPVQEQVELREETVHVERRPVDRPAGDIGAAAFQEKTIEVTETREEPVVSKTARVTEEVVVSKDVETRTETVEDKVRRTEVEVEDERKAKGGPAGKPAKK